MNVVVDTNIVFSGLLNPKGVISDLLFNSYGQFTFYAPSSMIDELNAQHKKLIQFSGLNEHELLVLKSLLLKKIDVIDVE